MLATLFSLLIEALHVKADFRIIHALVLKVDVLQPHSVLGAGLVSLIIVLYLVGQLKQHALRSQASVPSHL